MAKRKIEKTFLFEKIENFTKAKANIILIISIVIAVVFSIIFFNPDVTVGGDDSIYIKSAYDFRHGLAFPSWHGSMYSIVLSIVIFVFGLNLIVLKLVSVAFTVGSIYIIQKILLKISNYTVTAFTILATSLSLLLSIYASTTYSEPFFIFIQALYIYLFIKYITSNNNIKTDWKKMLLFGVLSYLMFQTRTVSIAAVGATLLYLLFEKKFINSTLYVAFIALTHLTFSFYKKIVWKIEHTGFEHQLEILRLKHPYKPNDGNDNLMGFIHRIWDNSEIYLSKHLMKMTGFKSIESRESNTILTIALLISIFFFAFIVIKKNKKTLFLVLYLVGIIGLTFVSLQKIWDQDRLIIIYFPYIVGIFFMGLWHLFQNKQLKNFQFLPIMFSIILLLSITAQSVKGIEKYSYKNKFKSGEFSSYNPDWQNYLKATRWASLNLSDTSVVVCRKPGMAWISGEGNDIFKGLYNVEYDNADSIQKTFEELGATHVIMANLRVNPARKTDKTINTIRKSLTYLCTKSPGSFELIKEFGEDEKAYLFKINLGEKTREEIFKNLDSDAIIFPNNLGYYYTKGSYYYSNKNYREALKYYLQPLSFRKDDPNIYFNIALCYYSMNDFNNASINFKKSLELMDEKPDAWFYLSICYINMQKIEDSRIALKRAKEKGLKRDPRQLEALLSKYN